MRRLTKAGARFAGVGAACVIGAAVLATAACAKAHVQAPAPSTLSQEDREGASADGHAVDMAYQTFAGACAPNLSRPEAMQLVMGGIGLKEAPDRVVEQIPHQEGDRVWVLPHEGVGVAAVWTPDGRRCQVLMQRGDLDKLKSVFATLLTATAKPGLAVDKVRDATAETPEGKVETLAYEVYATPKTPGGDDRVYTLTLHRGEAAKAAAVIEGARVSGGPKG